MMTEAALRHEAASKVAQSIARDLLCTGEVPFGTCGHHVYLLPRRWLAGKIRDHRAAGVSNEALKQLVWRLAGNVEAKPRFQATYCSQCGRDLGPGNSGVSSCDKHLAD